MAKNGGIGSDYTRVCRKCGTSRLLPEAMAKDKGPADRQVAGMQRATKFAVGRQREKYSMQASALQSHQDRVIQYATCPQCGSTEYDQFKPGEEPPASSPVLPTPAASPPPPATPPQWSADPFGRHELRFWDGSSWTAAVVDAGAPGIDYPA